MEGQELQWDERRLAAGDQVVATQSRGRINEESHKPQYITLFHEAQASIKIEIRFTVRREITQSALSVL